MRVSSIQKLTILVIIVGHLITTCLAYIESSGRGSYRRGSSRRGSYGRGGYGRGSYGRGGYGRGSYGRGGSSRGRPPYYSRGRAYPGISVPTTTFAPCPIDESLCNGIEDCQQLRFQCVNNGRCVPQAWSCNGVVDCSDSSDEQGCPPPPCQRFEGFECLKNSQCINMTERCDGKIDCDDSSDELNCNEHSRDCNNQQFTCKVHYRCIPRSYLCDGDEDCDDGSDENHCGNVSSTSTTLAVILAETRKITPTIAETTPATTITETTPATTTARTTPETTTARTTPETTTARTTPETTTARTTPETTTARTTPETTTAKTSSATIITNTTEQSCPKNYCMQNAECVAIDGRYFCNCPPSFSGEKCELRITHERKFPDLGIVIGVSMAFILFIIITLALVYYFKRRSVRYSTGLMSKTESQMPITSYSK